MTMNLNDRLYTDDDDGARTYTPTGLLIQLTYIMGGSVPSATPVVRAAAVRIVDEIIEAALGSGRPLEHFPEGPHSLPAETNYSLIAWLDGLCAAAGADVVQDIICGAFGRSGAKISSQPLQ